MLGGRFPETGPERGGESLAERSQDGLDAAARRLDAALDALRGLPPTQGEQVLVHQDLHADNVLAAEREPWLVIDPKPLAGERELDAVGLLRNAAVRGHSIRRWLDAIVLLGLDRERLRGWGVAHALAWGWDEDRGWSEAMVAAAHAIKRA